MDVQIWVADETGDELRELSEWLRGENELRGHVRVAPGRIGQTELGSFQESLNVALSTGGAGTVLASSLITWIRTRTTKASITVQSGERSVTFDIRTVGDVEPMLKQILSADDSK